MIGYKFYKSNRGISIVEMLVAISIFAVVGVTFVAVLGTNFRVILLADQRTIAESLAKTQMESIQNQPYDGTSPYTYTKITGIPQGYDINITVVLIDPETGAVSAVDLGIQKVTVTVTNQQHTPPDVIIIESYKK